MNQIETRVTGWHTCKDGPWYPSLPHGGFVAYRIWQQTDGVHWNHRHEWKRADGSIEMEKWIDGVRGWCVDAQPVPLAP